MAELSNAKVFGGIGALLMLFGVFVPYIGFIVSIVGLILVFIAVKTISELTNDKDIFRNYLFNFIFSILSIIALFAIMVIAFGVVGGFTWITEIQSAEITDFESFWAYFGTIIVGCILALIVAWILSIIAAIYLRRSYNSIAEHTKTNLFKTTGIVYLIGAITTIVVIGFLILFIARIIEIIAYFSLPERLPAEAGPQKMSGERHRYDRRCPNCDRGIPMDARICPYCGKKFEE